MSEHDPAPRRRGRRMLIVVSVGAVVLSVGAWAATAVIQSPGEAAANAGPPAPSLIAVPLESRAIGAEVVTRGTVGATQTVEAITAGAGSGALRALVSGHLPRAGDPVQGGGLIVEISGRPVLALRGSIPAYRDLSRGDVGTDAAQLNAALHAAGYDVAASANEYGAPTVAAVSAMYRDAGYPAPAGGARLPASEVTYLSTLPATVVSVQATLGGEIAEASIQVAAGDLAVIATIPADQLALATPGTKVVISSEILGKSVDGRIAAPLGGAGGDQGSAAGGTVTILPEDKLSGEWAGQDVRVRVLSATTGEKVLAAPVAAVVMAASGRTEVVVVDPDARTVGEANARRVAVTVGAVGAGWAEVTPSGQEPLAEGDVVQLSAATSGG